MPFFIIWRLNCCVPIWCLLLVRGQAELCCTAVGLVLSSHSILTATSSLYPTGSAGSALQFLVMHVHSCYTRTHAHSFRPLDLGCYDSSGKAAPRCQCVFLTSPAGTPTPAHPFSVCVCVMMINTFVLKANRELLCVCICVSLYVCVYVFSSSLYQRAWTFLCGWTSTCV